MSNSKPWVLRVSVVPALRAAVLYLLRVVSIERSVEPFAVRVEFEFMEEAQAGRTHVALLPLPVRPVGVTADYFRAVGIDVTAGGTVRPNTTRNKLLRAEFARAPGNGEWQIVRFASAEAS